MKSLKVKIIIGIVLTSAIVITSILVIRNNTDKENIDFASQNINENYSNNESTNNNTNIDNNDTTIKKEYLEGYEIAGYIKIPKTNIDIPILSQATVETLDLSVAIMYGVGLNNVGNNVIIGIDFFKDNSKLSIGDTIYITDQTKNEVLYEIYDIQKLKASDSSYYERDTKGKKEITLVTYTDVTYNRLVIFAKQK